MMERADGVVAVDEACDLRADQMPTEGLILSQPFSAHRVREHRDLTLEAIELGLGVGEEHLSLRRLVRLGVRHMENGRDDTVLGDYHAFGVDLYGVTGGGLANLLPAACSVAGP